MTVSHFLIKVRDGFLDLISGVRRTPALNISLSAGGASSTDDLGHDLRACVQEILVASLGEDEVSVDYGAVTSHPSYPALRRLTAALRGFDPLTLKDHEKQRAFWINLYNTLVIDGVIQLGIRRTVNERLMGFGFFHLIAYEVHGIRMNCDDIEHGILRGNRGHPFLPGEQFAAGDPRIRWVIRPFEPRIHFGLNCASRSCPPVNIFSGDDLDEQLEIATQNFLSHEISVDKENQTLTVSRIFNWYARDFGGRQGILDFILQHIADTADRRWLEQNKARVSLKFSKYDWSLNGFPHDLQ